MVKINAKLEKPDFRCDVKTARKPREEPPTPSTEEEAT